MSSSFHWVYNVVTPVFSQEVQLAFVRNEGPYGLIICPSVCLLRLI